MEAAIWIVAVLFGLFIALGSYAAVKAVGAAKRGVDRTVAQARRSVEDTTLKARQLTQPGAAGELAQLRLALRTSMRATQQTLQAAVPEDASLGESLALFDRLSTHGRELEDELKRLEREPDKQRITARLPELRERTERIVHSADSLRWAAQDRAHRFADDDLGALNSEIQLEAGALRHWAPVPEAASGADSGPDVRTDSRGVPGPPSARAEGAAPGPDGSEQQGPAAITARDPWQRTGFPWEKARRRPESTT
ncbi:MAG TPA: hypothetical protein DEQ61_25805 [Streptomyces sp.]|nr:hypothetical protein [Streptomyces sp.]